MSLSRLSFAALLSLLLFSGAQADPSSWLVVHTNPASQILDEHGAVLGQSGKPFNLPPDMDRSKPLILQLQAAGQQVKTLEISAKELENTTRLPAEGSYELSSGTSMPVIPILVILMTVSFLAFWQHRRRAQSESPPGLGPDGPAFQLGELLAQGGTSLIYRASSSKHQDKALVVKVLKPELASDQESRARFARSLKDSLKLQHANLTELYSSGINSDGSPYLLMELLEGQTLQDYLQSDPLPEHSRVLELMTPLCEVLSYLHQAGIVHRDIKPDNIFLSRDGKVKVMDLETSRSQLSEDLTKTGVAIGTPYYIAPEQAMGRPCPQSDQYALGVILFEMLTGSRPFEGADAVTVIRKHIESPAPSLMRISPRVSLLQQAVVHRMLSKRPAQRFVDMMEAKLAIQEALNPELSEDSTATSL